MLSTQRPLPAGLIDDRIEFFNDPNDPELAYFITCGQVSRVKDANESIRDQINADMVDYPEKIEALVQLGYEAEAEQHEKYCSCCFGAFDGEPDVVNGKFIHHEYWPCPKRGICPVEGKLCDALKVGEGKVLTRREIDVLTLVASGLLDKEIADQLEISCHTLAVHTKHIRAKSGLMNKKDLIILAHQKNLI